ncbi:MAG: hypothetical protein J5883_02710 [Clostridiales bacterium]|nr:hypothetical protein [Clostridiales bacterium]
MSNNIPDRYKPISMWGYFGYQILFGIPIIGLIFLLIFALGGSSNENVKNYARSYFCVLILSLVLLVVAIACGLGSVAAGILNDWLG